MMIKVLGGFALLATLSSAILGKLWLDQRDENARLEYAAQVAELTRTMVAEKEDALEELRDEYNSRIESTESDARERISFLQAQLATAQQDIAQAPVAFGDDTMRALLYTDCVWSLGARGTSDSERTACGGETAAASAAAARLAFTVLTPQFLAYWRDACESRGFIGQDYQESDWEQEYPSFDRSLCRESLVSITPQQAVRLRIFAEHGVSLTTRLYQHIAEQDELIEILRERVESE